MIKVCTAAKLVYGGHSLEAVKQLSGTKFQQLWHMAIGDSDTSYLPTELHAPSTCTAAAHEIGNNHLGVYSPIAPEGSVIAKAVCVPMWLNNLESVTPRQDIKGAATVIIPSFIFCFCFCRNCT